MVIKIRSSQLSRVFLKSPTCHNCHFAFIFSTAVVLCYLELRPIFSFCPDHLWFFSAYFTQSIIYFVRGTKFLCIIQKYTQWGVLAITVDVINFLTWKYGERIILIITYISKSFKMRMNLEYDSLRARKQVFLRKGVIQRVDRDASPFRECGKILPRMERQTWQKC